MGDSGVRTPVSDSTSPLHWTGEAEILYEDWPAD